MARAVGAEAVVEGSLQRQASRLRVNARLLRVSDGASLWAETLDERCGDLFAVQDRLAERIADALAPRLDPHARSRLVAPTTSDPLALELYLQGRYNWLRRTSSSLERALALYDRALERAPTFALAWAGAADVHAILPMTSDARPLDCFPRAREAARRALEIDPELAEGHSAAGLLSFWYDWDWQAAETAFRRALALSPSLLPARLFHAHLLSNTGRHVEALSELERARGIDPSSPVLNTLKGTFLYHQRRFGEALVQFDLTLAAEPDFWIARLQRGKLLDRLDRPDEAAADLGRAWELSEGSSEALSMRSVVAARRGDATEARRWLGTLEEEAERRWVPPTNLALARAACGMGGALPDLDRAVEERDPRLTFLGVDPKWDGLALHPRVAALRRDLGLPGVSPPSS